MKRRIKPCTIWAILLIVGVIALVLVYRNPLIQVTCDSYRVDACPKECAVCRTCENCTNLTCQPVDFCMGINLSSTAINKTNYRS